MDIDIRQLLAQLLCAHPDCTKPRATQYETSLCKDHYLARRREQASIPERAERKRAQNRENMRRKRADPNYVDWSDLHPEYQRQYGQRRHYIKRWGFPPEDIELVIERLAEGPCDICENNPSDGTLLHIDHDHDTNEIRGALCGDCNRALGLFRSNRDTLLSAIRYLTRPILFQLRQEREHSSSRDSDSSTR